jgi:hypothetical protein
MTWSVRYNPALGVAPTNLSRTPNAAALALAGLAPSVTDSGAVFTPNVGSQSTSFDVNYSGGSDVFGKILTGLPGGRTGLVRANMWGFGQSGYSTDWNVQINDYREYRFRAAFTNGGGSPKGYMGYVRGWAASESATNAAMGFGRSGGPRMDQVTKWKSGRNWIVDAISPASTTERGVGLDDIYIADQANPDTSRTHVLFNLLFHWYVSDPSSIAYWANNFNAGYTITTPGGKTYRAFHNPNTTPDFSAVADIYLAVMDGYSNPSYEWGRLSTPVVDFKDVWAGIRADSHLSSFFGSRPDSGLYLVSHQVGVEPVATATAQYIHWKDVWVAVQNEPDGGEAVPLGTGGRGIVSSSTPGIGFNGSTFDSDGGKAISRDRTEYWRSTGIPCSVVHKLGTVNPTYKARMLHYWECATSYSADPPLISQSQYNNVAAATLETHANDYGPTPSASWTSRATFSGNTRTRRVTMITPTAGSDIGMFRFRPTTSAGSSGNTDFAGISQLFSVPGTGRPSIAFMGLGDSQMANGLNVYQSGRTTEDICHQVYELCGQSVLWAPHGWPGQSANGFATSDISTLRAWLDDFPGKYCIILLGSNDGPTTSTFVSRMTTIGTECTSRGITPIYCTPPYSADSGHSHMGSLAAQIPTIVAAVSGALTGPDIYTLTQANDVAWRDPDLLHFNETGYRNIETAIASWISTNSASLF